MVTGDEPQGRYDGGDGGLITDGDLISATHQKGGRCSSCSHHLCRFSTYRLNKVAALTSTIEILLYYKTGVYDQVRSYARPHALSVLQGTSLSSLSSDAKKNPKSRTEAIQGSNSRTAETSHELVVKMSQGSSRPPSCRTVLPTESRHSATCRRPRADPGSS